MDEGLIIIDENYERVLFENKKAAKMGGGRNSFIVETSSQDNDKVLKVSQKPLFACCDEILSKQHLISDSENTKKMIN